MQYKKLWIAFGLIMLVSFAVLGGVGYKAINNGPPIPAKVVTSGWTTVVHRRDDSRRTECLAINRRAGNRHDLGTWSLCRSRLERGLSSSPVGNRAESLGEPTRLRGLSLLPAESRAALQGRLTELTRQQYLRRRQRHDRTRWRSRRGIRGVGELLR